MRAVLAALSATLLVVAGCSSDPEPDPIPPPAPNSSVAPASPAETKIVIGEPFTLNSVGYTAAVTIDSVSIPEQCDNYPNSNIAVEADVTVQSGDGTREVLNTGTIRERDSGGYLSKERTISRSCDEPPELDAMRAQTGDKFHGVIWLKEDVDAESEILINAQTGGGPISEVFVLDLSEIDLGATTEPGSAPNTEPQPANGASNSQTEAPRSIWAPPGQGQRCPGTDARVWDISDCNPSNGVISPDDYYGTAELNQQPAHDGVAIADGGTCPAYLCGYGHDENGNPHPSSGEIQTRNGCEDGYVTDAAQCAAVGVPIG